MSANDIFTTIQTQTQCTYPLANASVAFFHLQWSCGILQKKKNLIKVYKFDIIF